MKDGTFAPMEKENLFRIGRIRRLDGEYVMPSSHYHDNYEIYYLAEGQRNYFIKNKTYLIQKGDMVFLNKNELHRTLNARIVDHTRIVLEFRDSSLKGFNEFAGGMDLMNCFHRETGILRLSIKEQIYMENLLSKMIDEYQRKEEDWETYIKAMLVELLIFGSRKFHQRDFNAQGHPSLMHFKVGEVVKYISEHFGENITLTQMADNFHISSNYLSKIFKESTGFTLINYVNSIRIREAERLLRMTHWNVSKIADTVGYASITHLGRVFKKMTDYSPLEFRKLYSKK